MDKTDYLWEGPGATLQYVDEIDAESWDFSDFWGENKFESAF